ncbi:hypothetical protein EAF00_010524 [Botryotinia globosa]|nr:hypothetical protein EAF00_010524 [Botryotinia globosa]
MNSFQVSRKNRKNERKLFMDAWRCLANIEIDVEVETESYAPEQSQVITPSSQALTEFHLFPKLPLQIRRMIWEFTILPRAIQESNCMLSGGYEYDGFRPSVPRPLYPLNVVPYHSMPATFWACFESRNEIARYYQNIAFISENINLYPRYLPASFFEKSEPSSASNFYCIDQATLSFKKLRAEWPSRPLEPSIPFNPDQDIYDFDRLITTPVDRHHEWERDLLLHNIPLPSESFPWRRRIDKQVDNLLIHPWAIKRLRITPLSHCWSQFVHDFEKDDISKMIPIIFENFIFQDLDELILQDVDCMLFHLFNSQVNRDSWTEYFHKMFRVESSHNEFAAVRAGSTFKVPKIVFWLGEDNGKVCRYCLEEQERSRSQSQFIKLIKYEDKQLRIQAGGKF